MVLLVLRGHSHEQDHDHDEGDLNVRSAWLHVLGDTLSSVGVIVAGLVIWRTGWTVLDPLMSIGIGGVLFFGSGRLLKSGIHILMEGVPEGLHLSDVGQAMAAVPGVREIHDLHVWSLCPGAVALSAHVTVDESAWAEVAGIQIGAQGGAPRAVPHRAHDDPARMPPVPAGGGRVCERRAVKALSLGNR